MILLLLPIGLLECTIKQGKEEEEELLFEEEEELLFKFDDELGVPSQELKSQKLSKEVDQNTRPTNIDKEHIAVLAKEERIKLGAYDSPYQFLVEKLKCIEDGSYKYGDTINTPDKGNNNCTALHYAVKLQAAGIIQILLELKARLDIKDSNGKTPLDWAMQEQQPNLEIIQLLLPKTLSAVINSNQYEHGRTLLLQAIWNQQEKTALILLDHPYINVNTRETMLGFTPLHAAIYYGFGALVKKLLGKWANIYILDDNDRTPLELASQCEHKDSITIMEILLKAKEKSDLEHRQGLKKAGYN